MENRDLWLVIWMFHCVDSYVFAAIGTASALLDRIQIILLALHRPRKIGLSAGLFSPEWHSILPGILCLDGLTVNCCISIFIARMNWALGLFCRCICFSAYKPDISPLSLDPCYITLLHPCHVRRDRDSPSALTFSLLPLMCFPQLMMVRGYWEWSEKAPFQATNMIQRWVRYSSPVSGQGSSS